MPTRDLDRPTKRQRQGAASREEILVAATRLMSSRGYEGTSISDLARESGLPPSSIYWHFSSKRGVLEAVMERGAERFFADLPEVDALAPDDPRAVIGHALAHASRAVSAHPEFLRLFILLLLGDEPSHSHDCGVVRSVRETGRKLLHRVLRTAYRQHGELAALRVADRLVDFAQAAFDGAFLAVQYDPDLSYPLLMQQMADAIVALGDTIIGGLPSQPVPPRAEPAVPR